MPHGPTSRDAVARRRLRITIHRKSDWIRDNTEDPVHSEEPS